MRETIRDRDLRLSKKAKRGKCHIHDKATYGITIERVHQTVCVNEFPLARHTDGKNYCLFHMPTKKKDTVKFEEAVKTRLATVKRQIAQIRNAESNQTIEELSYDFSFVWFPINIDMSKYTFEVRTVFHSAVFSAYAFFKEAKFSALADFSSTIFSDVVAFDKAIFSSFVSFRQVKFSGVNFSSTTFKGKAVFPSTIFSGAAYFPLATFSEDANFVKAKFSSDTNFAKATFENEVDFTKTRFAKKAATDFSHCRFAKDTLFERTRFRNDVSFDSAVFGNDSDVFFLEAFFAKHANFRYCSAEGNLRFTNLRQGGENTFDFQDAAFERASLVSFHMCRLRPNWLINVNSEKFTLSHCSWRKASGEYIDAKSELRELIKRGIKKPHKLLRRAAWQLANIHEESKNFYTASLFRQIANESKRLEKYRGFKVWSLHWWYWLSSFYGESWQRALGVLFGILLIFTFYYSFAFFQICPKNSASNEGCVIRSMRLDEAVQHSLYTAAFQTVEYRRTLTSQQDILILLEKIFAPLQAALLALAIRRKFMR